MNADMTVLSAPGAGRWDLQTSDKTMVCVMRGSETLIRSNKKIGDGLDEWLSKNEVISLVKLAYFECVY